MRKEILARVDSGNLRKEIVSMEIGSVCCDIVLHDQGRPAWSLYIYIYIYIQIQIQIQMQIQTHIYMAAALGEDSLTLAIKGAILQSFTLDYDSW